MSQYPTVYDKNSNDEDKVMGLDLDLGDDNDDEENPLHAEYADGDEEAKNQKSVEVSK